MSAHQSTLFVLAALALLVIPGPAVMFIVSRSIAHGPKAGVLSVAGIALGGLVHVLFAALGLTAILATSATAFHCVKYVGAAYLIYLGVGKLLEKTASTEVQPDAPSAQAPGKLVAQGLVVQLFNPKIALFFLSFLPQFVDLKAGHATAQIVALGVGFITLGFVTDSAYALLAGHVGKRFLRSSRAVGVGKWITGLTYLSLGTLTAVSGSTRAQ